MRTKYLAMLVKHQRLDEQLGVPVVVNDNIGEALTYGTTVGTKHCPQVSNRNMRLMAQYNVQLVDIDRIRPGNGNVEGPIFKLAGDIKRNAD